MLLFRGRSMHEASRGFFPSDVEEQFPSRLLGGWGLPPPERYQGAFFAPWSTPWSPLVLEGQVLGGTQCREYLSRAMQERSLRAIVPGVIPLSNPPHPFH